MKAERIRGSIDFTFNTVAAMEAFREAAHAAGFDPVNLTSRPLIHVRVAPANEARVIDLAAQAAYEGFHATHPFSSCRPGGVRYRSWDEQTEEIRAAWCKEFTPASEPTPER